MPDSEAPKSSCPTSHVNTSLSDVLSVPEVLADFVTYIDNVGIKGGTLIFQPMSLNNSYFATTTLITISIEDLSGNMGYCYVNLTTQKLGMYKI